MTTLVNNPENVAAGAAATSAAQGDLGGGELDLHLGAGATCVATNEHGRLIFGRNSYRFDVPGGTNGYLEWQQSFDLTSTITFWFRMHGSPTSEFDLFNLVSETGQIVQAIFDKDRILSFYDAGGSRIGNTIELVDGRVHGVSIATSISAADGTGTLAVTGWDLAGTKVVDFALAESAHLGATAPTAVRFGKYGSATGANTFEMGLLSYSTGLVPQIPENDCTVADVEPSEVITLPQTPPDSFWRLVAGTPTAIIENSFTAASLPRGTNLHFQAHRAGDGGATIAVDFHARYLVVGSPVGAATVDGRHRGHSPDLPTGSGQDMPASASDGYRRVISEDFDIDAAEGSFTPNRYSSALTPDHPYASRGNFYPDGQPDTGHTAMMWPSRTVSVERSLLRIRHHTATIGGVPTALGAAWHPIIPGVSPINGDWRPRTAFGRYSFRLRTYATGPGYGLAALLIDSGSWPAHGELDFPEGDHTVHVQGNYHYADPAGGVLQVDRAELLRSSWRTYTYEWTPGRIRWDVDGDVILDSTDRVPEHPLAFVLQCGSNGTVPDPLVQAWVELDWFIYETRRS